jgi:hypothetical protein
VYLNSGDIHADLTGVRLVKDDSEADVIIIGGAGDEFNYAALNRVFAHLRNGARLVAMHRNLYWRTQEGLQLDGGAILLGLEAAASVMAEVVGKPAPGFFTSALSRLRVDAAEAIMIGDDIDADVLGAQHLGITGVLVKTGKFLPEALEAADGIPDHVVDSIADVPDLLVRIRWSARVSGAGFQEIADVGESFHQVRPGPRSDERRQPRQRHTFRAGCRIITERSSVEPLPAASASAMQSGSQDFAQPNVTFRRVPRRRLPGMAARRRLDLLPRSARSRDWNLWWSTARLLGCPRLCRGFKPIRACDHIGDRGDENKTQQTHDKQHNEPGLIWQVRGVQHGTDPGHEVRHCCEEQNEHGQRHQAK